MRQGSGLPTSSVDGTATLQKSHTRTGPCSTGEDQSQAGRRSFFLSKDSGESERERAKLRISSGADAHMAEGEKAKTEMEKVARHVRVRTSGPVG